MRKMMKINEQPIYSNYKRKSKFLGMIDYQSLIFLVAYALIIGYFCYFIPINLEMKIYLFLFLVIPVLAITMMNVHHESAIHILWTMLMFYHQRFIFLDKKNVKSLKNERYTRCPTQTRKLSNRCCKYKK